MANSLPSSFLKKIREHRARVGVIGLGYVGLPLLVEFAKKGFRATGIDVAAEKVRSIQAGVSYIPDIPSRDLAPLVRSGRLRATTSWAVLKDLDGVMICVPTPLRKTRDPDISYILAAAKPLAQHLHRHQVIILESTTYPGTTEEVILPLLSETGLTVGKDFFLGFSPERIDPGNPDFATPNIPKVVSGVTANCRRAIQALYSEVIEKVIPVSSTRVAEMVKLLENTFRSVNIGLVNELALMCHRMGVDVWEVIDAAKSKPFGFMPFYPGPGLGGHCIPIDPLYLSWKAKIHGFEPRFIELASQVNASMPEHVVERVGEILNRKGQALKGSRVLILGVAYKRNVSDTRESPALEVIQHLIRQGARVDYHDPYVPRVKANGASLRSVPLTPAALAAAHCVVVVTDHQTVDYPKVVRHARAVLDTRNALRQMRPLAKVTKL
ncbi:MAG: nucleotide sugar dehydrogenase [Candidatus Omnitrophica bacterium]|nr:nucleotide sugar dehydrogenase [Candidatus Omnitrophota bacterium]